MRQELLSLQSRGISDVLHAAGGRSDGVTRARPLYHLLKSAGEEKKAGGQNQPSPGTAAADSIWDWDHSRVRWHGGQEEKGGCQMYVASNYFHL